LSGSSSADSSTTEDETTTTTNADGAEVKTTTNDSGEVTAEVTVPSGVTKTTVTIPTTSLSAGTVAVIVKADGSEEIIKNCAAADDGLHIQLDESATIRLVDNTKTFDDVSSGNWASDAIAFASSRELFNGTSDSTFNPSGEMTRQMLMTVLARLDGVDTSKNAYATSVRWATERGITDGSKPTDSITREQLITMLWRYAGEPTATQTELSFSDSDQVSSYAQAALLWANENGILNGKSGNRLDPTGVASRAQVAQILMNFIKNQVG
jgi:hypothetical protein